MKNICVFCGSNVGTDPNFEKAARELGALIAQSGRGLVYGGGAVGLMGVVANAVMQHGGRVIGVIPDFLNQKEIGHKGLTELIEVKSMHERKLKMAELADGFIALPGGIGTLEELAEVFTWAQLGIHDNPVALLNVNGFYDPLVQMLQVMVERRFLNELTYNMLIESDSPADLLTKMESYQAPQVYKWLDKKQS
ncbi:MAG: TIGR00730 family Rossman fold protein [Bacteroidia bacterium]|nr:TIGR00730 family Rossman fold protein [Bacteroidia bacterium]